MKIKEILKETNGELICGNEELECENFSVDTRVINKGDTYIALIGGNFNGNDYVEEAIDNGANACIVSFNINDKVGKEKLDASGVTIVKVEDTLLAMQQIATYKRSLYNIPVVAVTGSVGKTSTKDMIASVMAKKYKVLKTQGNLNNDIGLPFTLLKLKDEDAVVIEMGMNHLGEISKLTQIAKPTVAVITNIGTAHIGNLGSRENILKAKLEILEGLQGDTVVINNDNDLLSEWNLQNNKYNVLTYGINNTNSKYVAKAVQLFEDKSIFTLDDAYEKITVPVAGEHFVLNSLCAIAVGKYYNIPMEKIIEGIKELDLSKKRMEIINAKCGATIINDTYNANFDSMRAAIKYLQSVNNKRRIAILGDMLELGEYSQKLHEDVGKEITDIDILITVGAEAKNIAKNAQAKEIYSFDENNDAIKKVKEIMSKNDVILVKASNSMKFINIVDALKEV